MSSGEHFCSSTASTPSSPDASFVVSDWGIHLLDLDNIFEILSTRSSALSDI